MRILLVSAHYPPDLGALATRASELTRAWAAEGHEVHVLCGLPSHPTGVVPPKYRGRLVYNEVIEGVHVHRTWTYATPNAGKLRRSIAFASFAVSALTIGQRHVPDPEVVVGTSPQFFAAVAGAMLARGRASPFVAEIRDLWPASIWHVGALSEHHPVIKVLERLEGWLYNEADLIVVVSDAFREPIARHVDGLSPDEVPVITNGVSLDRFDPGLDGDAVRAQFNLPVDRPVALYAGTHGMSHGLETVIDAARLTPEVTWVLVGEGARKEALVDYGRGVPNVVFLPGQPATAMPALYAMSDVALVPLRDLELFNTVIPSKLFEIWAMGRPLVLGVRGEAARIVTQSQAGVVVEPESAEALAAAVAELMADDARRAEMGAAGRRFVEEHYDRKVLAARYLRVLEGVARTGRRAGGRAARRVVRMARAAAE